MIVDDLTLALIDPDTADSSFIPDDSYRDDDTPEEYEWEGDDGTISYCDLNPYYIVENEYWRWALDTFGWDYPQDEITAIAEYFSACVP